MPPKDKEELSPELARAAIPLTSLACEAEPPKTLITLPNKGELTPVPLDADVPSNLAQTTRVAQGRKEPVPTPPSEPDVVDHGTSASVTRLDLFTVDMFEIASLRLLS